MCINLAVVCPVFNEERNVALVLEEWLIVLDKVVGFAKYHFIFLNDGSTDGTLKTLQNLAKKYSQVIILDKPNTGHGPTCIYSYDYAIQQNYDWIFQIDSDGQCDPQFFLKFWQEKDKTPWQMGKRTTRDDGWQRVVVSKILACVVWLGSGVYVEDSNVPYRLMPVQQLKTFLSQIPKDFFLANVLVSVFIQAKYSITWHAIHFRARFSGESKVRGFKFAKIGWHLFLGLKKLRPNFTKG